MALTAVLFILLIPACTNSFITVPVTQSPRSTASSLAAKQQATFGMGCFWKPSEELLKVPGVIDTVAGYTGKQDATSPPSYETVCCSRDWVEGVRVYYDDDAISYSKLLDAFFETQEPKAASRQYASIIFPHDQEQQTMADKWLHENQSRIRNDGITGQWTQVEPLSSFYKAEQYHQRYWQKTRPRVASMIALLVVSTGIFDDFTPAALQSATHTGANAIVLLGLVLVVVERKIDTKSVQL